MSTEAILGIAFSAVTAWYFYWKSEKKKLLFFDVIKKNLIVSKYEKSEEIDIVFKGKKIDGLAQIDVVLWSRGNEPIRRSDFLDADRLLIRFDESIPIANENPFCSRIAIDPKIRKAESGFEIDFDILENNDAIHISFLFNSSEAPASKSVVINGSISGLSGGCQRRSVHDNDKITSFGVIFWIIMSSISIYACIRLIYDFATLHSFKNMSEFLTIDLLVLVIPVSVFAVFALFPTSMALSAVWRSRDAISGSGRRFLEERGIL